MSMDNTSVRRFSMRRSDKVVLAVLGVLVLLIIALNILQRCGLSLVNGALMLYLPVLALLTLVGWGGYVLFRRIPNRTVKLVVGGVLGIVLLAVVVLGFTYISFVASIGVPHKYRTLVSPTGGRRLVVLRTLDSDEDRIMQRKAARLAADPEGDPEMTAADWGYVYRAYPEALLGLFYRSDADVEGEVYLNYRDGIAPATGEDGTAGPIGTMMLEWLEDDTVAHFYVENAGVAEGGECTVRF